MKESINKIPPDSQAKELSPADSDLANTNSEVNPYGVEASPTSTRSNFSRWLLWTSAFIFTATASAIFGATFALISPLSPIVAALTQKGELLLAQASNPDQDGWGSAFQYGLARPINILVMGVDRVLDAPANSSEIFAGRSDTILLVRFDPEDHSVRMLSIPRDTRIDDMELEIPKINHANTQGGAALAARVVSKTLNNVPIDRYVRVTSDAFRELVDLVGGVEVFVPHPMSYVDVTQKLEIDLEQGWQTLNGEQAEQFVRYRDTQGGDVGRVQRQQALLKALRERLQSPAVIAQLPQAVRMLEQYVDTNLSLEEMLALVGFSIRLDRDELKMVLLPGRFSGSQEYELSYWLMNERGRDRIMSQYFDQDPVTTIWADNNTERNNGVRIAIQNATDEADLARRVAAYLQENDFDNIYLVNDSPRHLSQTEIIVQGGNLEAAALLKNILGLGIVEADSTGDLRSDLTIRIGSDWLDKEF